MWRTFVLRSAKFVSILLVMDFVVGGVARWAFFHQTTGKYSRITQTLESAKADVFVFGSSHANRHYDPAVIEKELGLSCYNAGVQGQGILFIETLQEIVLRRVRPKLIILDVDPGWLDESPQTYDRLADLHPYYYKYREVIGAVLGTKSAFERVKLLCRLYQYNSTLVHIVRYYVDPQDDVNGFRPLVGAMRSMPSDMDVRRAGSRRAAQLDENFTRAFARFLTNAGSRGIAIVAVRSPEILPPVQESNASFEEIRAILNAQGVPLFNFATDRRFVNNGELFHDSSHLNGAGAELFSKFVSDAIRAAVLDKQAPPTWHAPTGARPVRAGR